ncbi:MAG: hypothetical protein HY036_09580 [Nitrospirae bacterium]|nr:hypothetical protein [Nitrospirota bacterium]MBI3352815.1 hypothetical protein [Nitrospirota bacterium]
MSFEKIESISYETLLEILPSHLSNIHPDLTIRAERVRLNKEDSPFLLVLNRKEKRIGTLELLKNSPSLPTQILSHAVWLTQNSYALANLNKNEFDPDLPPFVIGLVSISPLWAGLCSFIKFEMTLLKYQAISYQGVTGLIFDPLFGSFQKNAEPSKSAEEKVPSPFLSEGFNEMGLTEAEIRFFSN